MQEGTDSETWFRNFYSIGFYRFPVFRIVNNKEYYCSDRVSVSMCCMLQIFSSSPDRYESCLSVYRNMILSCNNILAFGKKSKKIQRSFVLRAGCVEQFPFWYWGGKS